MPAGRTLQPRGPVHVSIVAFSVTQCQLIDATTIVGVDDDGIELQSAADRLGVHYQTAYGWVRSGRLPATLVRRRYRIAPAALAAFAAERDRPRRPGPRRPRNGFTEVSRKMSADLVAGEEGRARAVVDRLVADGVELTTVMQDVLAPTLRLVGDEWAAGRLTIAVEHRASAIVERIIGSHLPTPRGRRRGTAVVAALSGDRHTLPTAMAAAALREDRWHVHHLGADVPPDDLVSFCGEHPVELVALTVTTTDVAPAARRTAQRLARAGVRTIVGRPGVTLPDLQQMARDRRAGAA
jgi:excisionase family DNA binding protein